SGSSLSLTCGISSVEGVETGGTWACAGLVTVGTETKSISLYSGISGAMNTFMINRMTKMRVCTPRDTAQESTVRLFLFADNFIIYLIILRVVLAQYIEPLTKYSTL
ncbi:MAG: hypothetical protein JSV84_15785, partial [Gemmatimonadota bacterium]